MVVYVDAANATDLQRHRLMGGVGSTFMESAIVYCEKWQPTVAMSSTEVDLIAVVSAAKTAKKNPRHTVGLCISPEGPYIHL